MNLPDSEVPHREDLLNFYFLFTSYKGKFECRLSVKLWMQVVPSHLESNKVSDFDFIRLLQKKMNELCKMIGSL